MKKVNVYIHGENSREIKEVEINEESAVEDIIANYKQEFKLVEVPGSLHVFSQQDDENVYSGASEMHGKQKLKPRGHYHCHQCKEIQVSVTYNGQIHTLKFAPSITGKQILKKIIKEFGITEKDAVGMELKVSEERLLQLTDHIGSFAAYPACNVSLILSPKINIQG